ncbi:magnesium-translocating P-type ATPase [Schlesneria sp. T3-172]|uniref:magnesium-translocating P-type ATPase n=1 Tax=Schlesneria sphaerica TaxID=3373610 RepID=UPI0037C89A1B
MPVKAVREEERGRDSLTNGRAGSAVPQDLPFWAVPVEKVLTLLGSSEDGISQAEAQKRLATNRSLIGRKQSPWRMLLDQFKNPIILLLLCSAMLSFSLPGESANAWIIIFILLASGLLGFWQELSAADAVAKLLGLIETRAMVTRDGEDCEVPIDAVVPGDVIRLTAGNLIPGDCRLLTAQDLYLNEAALTGESFPAEKVNSVLEKATPLSQRINTLYLGTHVVSGMGTAVVVRTARDTEFGKISERLEQKRPETGFARGLAQFGRMLVKIVSVITVVLFAVKVGWQGDPVTDSLLITLALAVGMTPQLLPAITSVVLSAGAKSMARHHVIVKQLLSIENLGGMTVLCSDKTGTLTEGEIHLHSALDPTGNPSERVTRLSYLNAFFQTGFANPVDRAILAASAMTADDARFTTNGIQKLDEIPYDFLRKRLSVRLLLDGEKLLITKGALANILEVCSTVETTEGNCCDLASLRDSIERQFTQMSNEGLRILGLAVRRDDSPHLTKANECEMTFLGFLVFTDPPKADARETLEQLKQLGVKLKIITGDNRAVAATVSQRVGITASKVITGSELRQLSDEALRHRVSEADVFAEIEPNQKEQIIRSLQRNGEVVGYIGDGINDASALHVADVGISVATAVDVAREAAQIVLLKHDLGVLVEGVREGRRTFANTLKYVYFAIAGCFGYMFSLAIASLFLPFEPLLASQILLINLLADFPAMSLATDSVDPEQVAQPRRWDTKSIFRFMLFFGFASSSFDFLTFGAILLVFGAENHDLFRTGWFVESTLTGLLILLIVRTQRPFFRSEPSTLLLMACALIAVIVVGLPYSPLASTLGFIPPSPLLLGMMLIITALYALGMETVKFFFYRHFGK